MNVISRRSNLVRIEREKNDKDAVYYDQQITRGRDEIKRLNRQIEDPKAAALACLDAFSWSRRQA
jgi:hypothetical protein